LGQRRLEKRPAAVDALPITLLLSRMGEPQLVAEITYLI
jgi:hypothetical protein